MSDTPRDKWEMILDEKLAQLKICQTEHQQTSCLNCPEFQECELRDEYIKSVYESMSKGEGGGFEF
ncbi:MAG TPA: hypothetical protein EYG98_01005 [Sulfurovum sp.]|nr:hypothetical protein [Sulfurovum sp.]